MPVAGAVFYDEELDRTLRADGYVVFDLLDPEAAQSLRVAYHEEVGVPADAVGGMAFDYMSADRTAMEKVEALLAPVWEEHLPRHFVDLEVVFSTFVVKRPGDDSGMFLHDDRTFVDERRHRSFTAWVPLVDVSPALDNGTLYLVPGSHRIMPAASGTATPDWIRPYERYFERHLRPVSLRAGQALVYDTKTLHGSTPNRTSHLREAIATALAPAGAELIHVVADGDLRHVHQVDRDFFRTVHPATIEQQGMPDRYPTVDTYLEERTEARPEDVAAVCDPADVPVPVVVDEAPRGIEPVSSAESGERSGASEVASVVPASSAASPPGRLLSRLRAWTRR